jgi:hypothetical protein
MSFLKIFPLIASLTLVGSLAACSLPQVTQRVEPAGPEVPAVRVLAMAPGAGELGQAVARALRQRGYEVVDAQAIAGLIGPAQSAGAQPMPADALVRLKARGVDAVVLLESASGYDLVPLLVSARLQAADSGALWSDLSWRNGEGAGRVGTFIDRAVRVDLAQAADQIAAALVQPIQPVRPVKAPQPTQP